MSTANDLREAAITNEPPYDLDWEVMEVFIDNNEYRLYSDADFLTHRTFLLFVAEALDGGGRGTCEWAQDPDWGCWETECENIFELIEGTPKENKMAYCCYCGGKVKETK